MNKFILLIFITLTCTAARVITNGDSVAFEIGRLFKYLSQVRYEMGLYDGIKRRPVFLKPHACAKASFVVSDELPDNLQTSIFTPGAQYETLVRFSSDTVPDSHDNGNHTIGISIKLQNVPTYLNGNDEQESSHDFLMQNHNIFFVDNAKEFLIFNQYIFNNPNDPSFNFFPGLTLEDYLKDHPKTAKILDDMKKETYDILKSSFWSITPFKHGLNHIAKYKLSPCRTHGEDLNPIEDRTNPDYLKKKIQNDLAEKESCFEFQVQPQSSEKQMPVDQASVEWCEKPSEDPASQCFGKKSTSLNQRHQTIILPHSCDEVSDDENSPCYGIETSAPQTLGFLILPKQENLNRFNDECEALSFNPGRAHPDHKGLGSLNAARAFVYQMLADFRQGFGSE